MPLYRCRRDLAGCLALLGISLCGGCLGFVHPIHKPAQDCLAFCEIVPQACKNRVYVFMIQGMDPFDMGNLDGVCDYIHSLGFIKTYLGMPYHVLYFQKEICRIHEKEPTSRFVVLGYGCGAPLARELTSKLEKAEIPIDLLIYLDGVCLDHKSLDHPANAIHVVHLVAGKQDDSNDIVHGEFIECEKAWHLGTPTHPETLRMLGRELPVVAERVPVIDILPEPIDMVAPRRPGLPVLPPPQPGAPVLPPPNPGAPAPSNVLPAPTPTAAQGEWDFLEPDGTSVGTQGIRPVREAPMVTPVNTR
jgi:hypothetical protein